MTQPPAAARHIQHQQHSPKNTTTICLLPQYLHHFKDPTSDGDLDDYTCGQIAKRIGSGVDKLDEVIVADKDRTEIDVKKKNRLECEAELWGACHNYAVFEGKAGNHKKANELYKKACDGGLVPESCYNLCVYYNDRSDKKTAKKYCDMACKKDHFVACYNQGIIVYDEGDKESAAKLFTKACNGKVKEACRR